MNKHLNLFYSYQTHHLENNVTRSLIVTLKNLSPINVRLFLRQLVFNKPNEMHGEFLQKLDLLAEANLSFDLQAAPLTDEEKLTAQNGRIIGINYSGSQTLQFDPSVIEDAGTRPDASLTDKGCGVMIAFEAKLADTLYREQLQGHHQKLFDPIQTPLASVFIQTNWNEIVLCLDQIAKLTDNP